MIGQEDEVFDLRLQSNAATHDEDSNTFQATSIFTKLNIVATLKRKAPGGDYAWITKKLLENLGRSSVGHARQQCSACCCWVRLDLWRRETVSTLFFLAASKIERFFG